MVPAESENSARTESQTPAVRGVQITEIAKTRQDSDARLPYAAFGSPLREIKGTLEQTTTPSVTLMHRSTPGGDNTWILGGGSFVGDTSADGDARVQAVEGTGKQVNVSAEVAKVSEHFPYWRAVRGHPVSLSVKAPDKSDQGIRLDERLLTTHPDKPYAFLATERKVPDQELAEYREETWTNMREADRVRQRSTEKAKEADDYKAELQAITDAQKGSGYRNVEMYIGGMTPEDVEVIAQTVAQAACVAQPAYFFAPDGPVASLEEVRAAQKGFYCSTETAAIVFDNTPRYEKEMKGVAVRERAATAVNHNIPLPAPGEVGIDFGKVQSVGGTERALVVSRRFLEGHLVLSGKSGAGKTETMYNILTGVGSDGVPFTLVQPGFNPYAEVLTSRLATVDGLSEKQKKVIAVPLTNTMVTAEGIAADTESAVDTVQTVPIYLDIFRPYPGFRWKGHIEGLTEVIGGVVGGNVEEKGVSNEEARRIVDKIIIPAFFGLDYKDATGKKQRLKGLLEEIGVDVNLNTSFYPGWVETFTPKDVQEKCSLVIDAYRYGPEAWRTVDALVASELNKIFEGLSGEVLQPGQGYPIDIKKFYEYNTAVSLGNMISSRTSAIIMGTFLLLNAEHAEVKPGEHVFGFEELQNVLGGPLGDTIGRMYRTGRNQGEILIANVQNLTRLTPEIGGNAAHLALRTTWGSDINAAADALALTSSQKMDLPNFERTEGFLTGWGTDYGVLRVKGRDRSTYDTDPNAKPGSAVNVVRLGIDEPSYSRTEIIMADRYLDTTKPGVYMTAWAAWTTMAALAGLPDVIRPGREYLEHLSLGTETVDPNIRDRAINQAVMRFLNSKERFHEILTSLKPDIRTSEYPLEDIGREIAPKLRRLAAGGDVENGINPDFVLTGDPNYFHRMRKFLVGEGEETIYASLNHILGESVTTMIDQGRENEVRQRLNDMFAYFDFPAETLAFIRSGYEMMIEALIGQRTEIESKVNIVFPGTQ